MHLYRKYWLLTVVVIFATHALYLNCVAEDSYITYRFAKNLANGHGLVWNIAEPPIEGYTNFLWVIICAGAIKLGFRVPLFTQIIGAVASMATIFYTYRFAGRLLKLKAEYSLIPCLILSVSGPFATWAVSGMETNFFGLFLLVGCYHFVSYWRFNSRRDIAFCFVALLVATLTRPEGFMVFVILAALGGILAVKSSKQCVMDHLQAVMLYAVPFSIYFLWRLSYFGDIFPNTFYAKTGGALYQYIRGARYTVSFIFFFVLPLFVPVSLLIWEKRNSLRVVILDLWRFFKPARNSIGIYACGLITVVYTLCIVCVGGDYMAMYRFFAPLLPFIYLLFGVVANDLFSAVSGTPLRRAIARGSLLLVVAAFVIQSTPLEKKLFGQKMVKPTHGNFRGVEKERWAAARLSLIGKFFNEYKVDYNESLAIYAIGAISYYADMKIIDRTGLVDKHIARRSRGGKIIGSGKAGHEKKDDLYVLSKKPTYFMFNRQLTEKPLERPVYADNRVNEIIRKNYKLTSVWLTDTVNDEEGYFTFLELVSF